MGESFGTGSERRPLGSALVHAARGVGAVGGSRLGYAELRRFNRYFLRGVERGG